MRETIEFRLNQMIGQQWSITMVNVLSELMIEAAMQGKELELTFFNMNLEIVAVHDGEVYIRSRDAGSDLLQTKIRSYLLAHCYAPDCVIRSEVDNNRVWLYFKSLRTIKL